MYHPEFEMAIVRWLASLGGRHWFVDGLAIQLVGNLLFRSFPCVALLAGYWGIASGPAKLRATRRIVVAGFLMAGLGLLLSRFFQSFWQSPRPIHNPALSGLFHPKFLLLIGEDVHSFPSDHAAFIFPLVWAVARLQRSLGVATAILLAGALFARIYVGVHFPVDVLGGLLLGVGVVLSERLWPAAADRGLALVEAAQASWPLATAALLFMAAYSYASMHENVRQLAVAAFRAFLRL